MGSGPASVEPALFDDEGDQMGRLLLLLGMLWLAVATVNHVGADQRIAMMLVLPVMFVFGVFLLRD